MTPTELITALEGALPQPPREGVPVVLPTEVVVAVLAWMEGERRAEAMETLLAIDGELYGEPPLENLAQISNNRDVVIRVAKERAGILSASSAWGFSEDAAIMLALVKLVEGV